MILMLSECSGLIDYENTICISVHLGGGGGGE